VPTYDYQCRSCGAMTEVIHSMLEDGPSVCERCGGELRRVLYPAGIIFKGSGFYRTDSRADRSANGGSSSASSTGSSAGASEKAASTSKTDNGPSTTSSEQSTSSKDKTASS
jgi:putative FmdB family regulatory protein